MNNLEGSHKASTKWPCDLHTTRVILKACRSNCMVLRISFALGNTMNNSQGYIFLPLSSTTATHPHQLQLVFMWEGCPLKSKSDVNRLDSVMQRSYGCFMIIAKQQSNYEHLAKCWTFFGQTPHVSYSAVQLSYSCLARLWCLRFCQQSGCNWPTSENHT